MVWAKLGPTFGGFQTQAGQLGAQWLAATGDMSTRKAAVIIIRKGKEFFDGIFQRASRTEKFGKVVIKEDPQVHCGQILAQSVKKTPTTFQSKWLKYFQQAKTQNLAAELRNAAAKQFQSGSSMLFRQGIVLGQRRIPLYAFLGLGLSAGGTTSYNATYNEQDFNFDGICQEIKSIFQPGDSKPDVSSKPREFEDYEFGQMIAKGCNAAVYEARIKTSTPENSTESPDESITVIPEPEAVSDEEMSAEGFEFVDPMEVSSFSTGSDITIITEDSETASETAPESLSLVDGDFDLAVKMMFNYDAESHGYAILRTMNNEALPAKMAASLNQMHTWENGNHPKKKVRLKPHPNVVDMREVFVDEVQMFPGSMREFPHALPTRLNPEGFGRNRTMYLVMKRYDLTLRDYLHQQTPTLRESMLLLTQLVEAVVHLGHSGVAHRDIKSDNILLDLDLGLPQLVLSDFGCSLADSHHGNMCVPYFTEETSKGGNRSLMAPEIVCAVPDYGVYLDYSQSDIWACGTLAYEIFGGENPFYRSHTQDRLNSATYSEEELPDLPDHVPNILQSLVKAMLTRDPSKRPTAEEVSSILHILLWGTDEWKPEMTFKGHPECKVKVMRWLMTFCAGVMCQRALQKSSFIAMDSVLEFQLKSLFLSRLDLDGTLKGLRWIQQHVD